MGKLGIPGLDGFGYMYSAGKWLRDHGYLRSRDWFGGGSPLGYADEYQPVPVAQRDEPYKPPAKAPPLEPVPTGPGQDDKKRRREDSPVRDRPPRIPEFPERDPRRDRGVNVNVTSSSPGAWWIDDHSVKLLQSKYGKVRKKKRKGKKAPKKKRRRLHVGY